MIRTSALTAKLWVNREVPLSFPCLLIILLSWSSNCCFKSIADVISVLRLSFRVFKFLGFLVLWNFNFAEKYFWPKISIPCCISKSSWIHAAYGDVIVRELSGTSYWISEEILKIKNFPTSIWPIFPFPEVDMGHKNLITFRIWYSGRGYILLAPRTPGTPSNRSMVKNGPNKWVSYTKFLQGNPSFFL